jgi:hypothetical protein
MQLLYKEILSTEPTAFAGKSKMRPSDAYDYLLNKKITNPQMNKILGPVQKLGYLPNSKAGKWGTGLMAAGTAYGLLNYGVPAYNKYQEERAKQSQAKDMQNTNYSNMSSSALGGRVDSGSSTYALGRDDASVGNYQFNVNRATSATVANKKTKWIKTSEL